MGIQYIVSTVVAIASTLEGDSRMWWCGVVCLQVISTHPTHLTHLTQIINSTGSRYQYISLLCKHCVIRLIISDLMTGVWAALIAADGNDPSIIQN